jgi:TPR repeat protein
MVCACYGVCLPNGNGISIDLRNAAHYLKLSADYGISDGQCEYGVGLLASEGISTDLNGAVHYLKLSADHGHPAGQCESGIRLLSGKGVSINLKGAAKYCRLSADQGNVKSHYHYGMCLLSGLGLRRDLSGAIRDFTRSAELDNPDGQFIIGWMAENGIGNFVELSIAARNYELSSDGSVADSARYGWCSYAGKGVPVNFTVTAGFFKKASDVNDANGANSFGCCLERGRRLMTTSNAPLCIIELPRLSLIRTGHITLRAISNTAKGLTKASSTLRNAIACPAH